MSKDKLWIEIYEDGAAEKGVKVFWSELSNSVQTNTFWADEIKLLRDEPEKRLALAYQYLPLPRAFKEAAVAIRALIRKDRKNNVSYDERLSELYHLAVMYSFGIRYSTKLGAPGFNVFERVPGGVIYSLPFEYKEIGYDQLELLTKTDKELLVEKWGAPKGHSTLHQKHKAVWDHYEDILCKEREADRQKFIDEMKNEMEELQREIKDGIAEIELRKKQKEARAKEAKKWWEVWK